MSRKRNRNQRRISRSGRQGFTLMEVLLVLMILVVLASMAVTIFGGTQDQALKDAAKGEVGVFKTRGQPLQIPHQEATRPI